MVHSFLGIVTISFFLAITRDSDAFFSYSAKIEALFIAFSISTLNPARTVDRFSAVFSASAKSLI
jgi:hypothetical protein